MGEVGGAAVNAEGFDVVLRSLDDWLLFSKQHPRVLRKESADEVGRRILLNGFIEPLTQICVSSKDIVHKGASWREGLHFRRRNSRVRAVTKLVDHACGSAYRKRLKIYSPEAMTSFALLMRGSFPMFVGSEFGVSEEQIRDMYPVPHQDLTQLTLPSDAFDIVSTNEVLEHVSGIDEALGEIARVLRPGGVHIGTCPFRYNSATSDVRSKLVDGSVHHLKEPMYHGNPFNEAAPGAGQDSCRLFVTRSADYCQLT